MTFETTKREPKPETMATPEKLVEPDVEDSPEEQAEEPAEESD